LSNLKVIITGSTGMVGKGVLYECLDSPDVESVLLVNRNPIGISHPKLKEVILWDFFHPEAIRENLKGYNACFYCVGVTSIGMKEGEYSRIMYDMTLVFAKEVFTLNPQMTFCFVSGAGTDTTEQGRSMWARVKGKTENELLSLGFKHAYMFRPGYIQPKRGIKSKTGWYNLFYSMLGSFYFMLKRIPKYVTDTVIIGRAMINVALNGYSKSILESIDINEAGK